MEQKCTIRIGDTELEGTIDVERKPLSDEQAQEMRELKTRLYNTFQRVTGGRWTPPSPIIDSTVSPVIEDETRLIEQKASD